MAKGEFPGPCPYCGRRSPFTGHTKNCKAVVDYWERSGMVTA